VAKSLAITLPGALDATRHLPVVTTLSLGHGW
jgi:hypothetical protein